MDDPLKSKDLNQLRQDLLAIDHEILSGVLQRLSVVDEIARLKLRMGLAINQQWREDEVMEALKQRFSGRMDQEIILKVYTLLNQLSKTAQEVIFQDLAGKKS